MHSGLNVKPCLLNNYFFIWQAPALNTLIQSEIKSGYLLLLFKEDASGESAAKHAACKASSACGHLEETAEPRSQNQQTVSSTRQSGSSTPSLLCTVVITLLLIPAAPGGPGGLQFQLGHM